MIPGQVAQGDVLISPVEAGTPRGTVVPPLGGVLVIASGEISGHRHTIPAHEAQLFELAPVNPVRRLLVSPAGTTMSHGGADGSKDHDPVSIVAGESLVILQEHIVGDMRQQVGD